MFVATIKTVDFLGPQATLKAYNSDRFQTIIGGITSLITLIIIFCLTGYFSFLTFSRQNAKQIIYNEEKSDSPVYNHTKYPFYFNLVDLTGASFPNAETLFNIQLLWYHKEVQGGSLKASLIKLTYCKQRMLGEFQDMYSTSILEQSLCLDQQDPLYKNITVHGVFGKLSPNGWLSYYVNKCVNNTIPGVICKSKDEIATKLDAAYAKIVHMGFQIDNQNLTSPGSLYLDGTSYSLSPSIFKLVVVRFREVFYDTDYGFIFPDRKVEKYYAKEEVTETVNLLNEKSVIFPGNFAIISILASETVEKYFRSYPTIQDLLAQIGGVMKGILFLATLLERFLVNKLYISRLANDLFTISEPNNYINSKNSQKNSSAILNNFTSYGENIEKSPCGTIMTT
jgi:hypothetical protein